MGGDEFCVIIDGQGAAVTEALIAAQRALSERGDGFSITSSSGTVSCPAETRTVAEALRTADARMYVAKTGRALDQAQTRDAVLKMLQERDPSLLRAHAGGGSDRGPRRSAAAARRRERPAGRPRRGAARHRQDRRSPTRSSTSPGELDANERRFMRQYPIVGQRILRSAPALAPVAPLVRSLHERWDGHGYPDGLRGDRDRDRGPDHLRLRRISLDALASPLPRGAHEVRGDRRAPSLCGHPVRPRRGRCV